MGPGLTDFFMFRRMLTPALIRIVWWVGSALVLVMSGLGGFVGGLAGNTSGIVMVLAALSIIIIARIICELIIVQFVIAENLTDLRRAALRQAPEPPAAPSMPSVTAPITPPAT